jgi:hypothetical protein
MMGRENGGKEDAQSQLTGAGNLDAQAAPAHWPTIQELVKAIQLITSLKKAYTTCCIRRTNTCLRLITGWRPQALAAIKMG